MKTIIVKVIGKKVKDANHEFTVYSVLNSHGKFYRTAGCDPKDLEAHDREVVAIDVSRKYDKKVTKADKTEVLVPTLVIEGIRKPSEDEIATYQSEMDATNAPSLEDL